MIQHHGHSGSNQKSRCVFVGLLSFAAMKQHPLGNGQSRSEPPFGTNSRAPCTGCSPIRLVLTGVALPNLTRDQAVERAALVTVDSYRIELDLTDGAGEPGEKTFRSATTVEFDALRRRRHLHRHRRRHASTAPRSTASTSTSPATTSPPASPLPGLAEHNVLVVDADCRYSNTGEGLHRFVDPVDGEVYLYSQFETADAKRMFACFDQPDLKATFDVTVTAPAHWQVISNGATGRTSTPSGDAKQHTFATTPRMSTYLVALIAGPYARVGRRLHRRARRDPAGHLLPRLAGRVHGRRAAVHRDQAGIRLLPPATSACRTRSASTTSCSCRSSTPARWRTPAR